MAKLFGWLRAIAGVLIDQARHLARLNEEVEARTREGQNGPEGRLARSVAAIARARPEAMEEVAILLGSIERLVVGPMSEPKSMLPLLAALQRPLNEACRRPAGAGRCRHNRQRY